jgi:thiamine biosynthesis lipoprotein
MGKNASSIAPCHVRFSLFPESTGSGPCASVRFLTFLFFFFFIVACGGGEKEIVISGRTMGTTYQVKAYAGAGISENALAEKISRRLEELNRVFSTYRPDSEISRFNRFDRTGKPFPVSEDFVRVMKTAKEIYRLTEGAWDGTVDPLVRLWGFHDQGSRHTPPPQEEIHTRLRRVGFRYIDVLSSGSLVKRRADVSLDLASIAKGDAVDQIAALLTAEGIKSHLVDIGGEVTATNRKADGTAWKVGINRPDPDSAVDSVYRVVALVDRALATSGDYRNFFLDRGVVYSHVIDPHTGKPVQTGVVSASVLARTCAFADGLATALMVMPPAEGLRLVEQITGVECMIVVRRPGGGFSDHLSSGFPSS